MYSFTNNRGGKEGKGGVSLSNLEAIVKPTTQSEKKSKLIKSFKLYTGIDGLKGRFSPPGCYLIIYYMIK